MKTNINNEQTEVTAMKTTLTIMVAITMAATLTLIPTAGWAQGLSSFSKSAMVQRYAKILDQCPGGVCPSADLVKKADKTRAFALSDCFVQYGASDPKTAKDCEDAVGATPATFKVGGDKPEVKPEPKVIEPKVIEPKTPCDDLKGKIVHGDCQNVNGKAVVTCNDGWKGPPACNTKSGGGGGVVRNPCDDLKGKIVHGKCENVNGKAVVTCDDGWKGPPACNTKSGGGGVVREPTVSNQELDDLKALLANLQTTVDELKKAVDGLKTDVDELKSWGVWNKVALGTSWLSLVGLVTLILRLIFLRKKEKKANCAKGCKLKDGKLSSGKPGEPCSVCKTPFPAFTKAQKAEVDAIATAQKAEVDAITKAQKAQVDAITKAQKAEVAELGGKMKAEIDSLKGISNAKLEQTVAELMTAYSEAQALDVGGTIRALMIKVSQNTKDPELRKFCNGIDEALSPTDPDGEKKV